MTINQYVVSFLRKNRRSIHVIVSLCLLLIVPLTAVTMYYSYVNHTQQVIAQEKANKVHDAVSSVLKKYQEQLYTLALTELHGSKRASIPSGMAAYWVQGNTITTLKNTPMKPELTSLLPLAAQAGEFPYSLLINPAVAMKGSNHFVPFAIGVHDRRLSTPTGVVLAMVPLEQLLTEIRSKLSLSSIDFVLMDYQRQPILASRWYDTLESDGFLATNVQLHQLDEVKGHLSRGIAYKDMMFTDYYKMEGYPLILFVGSTPIAATGAALIKAIIVGLYFLCVLRWMWKTKTTLRPQDFTPGEQVPVMTLTPEQLGREQLGEETPKKVSKALESI